MIRTVSASIIKGKLNAPSSKSAMIRAVAAAALAKGQTILLNPSYCDDALAAIAVTEQLGALIKKNGDRLIISSTGTVSPTGSASIASELNCGESGLSLRMFSAIASLLDREIKITGRGSLLKRPLGELKAPLCELGVKVNTSNGFLPVEVKGPLKGGRIRMDGSLSSQFLTGLLMSLPLAEKDSVLIVDSLKSKPYIDLTIELVKQFGVSVEHIDHREFYIEGGQKYTPAEYTVEGDWSGAAFLLVAGALAGRVEVSMLDSLSAQADIAILEALRLAGSPVSFSNGSFIVEKQELKAFEFDINECPDLAPPLVCLAAACDGETVLSGTKRLVVKESNRAVALKQEFGKLGIDIEIGEDIMKIRGGKIKGGKIFSHNDHRIAMAGAVAGLIAEGPVEIDGAECVSKSWPGFFEDIGSIGASYR